MVCSSVLHCSSYTTHCCSVLHCSSYTTHCCSVLHCSSYTTHCNTHCNIHNTLLQCVAPFLIHNTLQQSLLAKTHRIPSMNMRCKMTGIQDPIWQTQYDRYSAECLSYWVCQIGSSIQYDRLSVILDIQLNVCHLGLEDLVQILRGKDRVNWNCKSLLNVLLSPM